MFLSIIVPVYNVEKYVKQCIESIVCQIHHMSDVEIIIVNDGSTDDSMNIINSISTDNIKITIINQENQGLSQARNKGFTHAIGRFVWFVDSDDYLRPNAIQYFKDIYTHYPNFDVYSSFMDRYVENTKQYIKKDNHHKTNWSGKEYLFNHLPRGAAQRFIYNREFIESNNLRFIPGILHEDGVWGTEMLYSATNVFLLPESIYVYRLRSNGSIMSNIRIKSAYDLLKGHKILSQFLNERVEGKDYFLFREYIFSQIGNAFGYSKHLFKTEEFKTFYKEYQEYIIKEARWLVTHGSKKPHIIICAISPRILMICMQFRVMVLDLLRNKTKY